MRFTTSNRLRWFLLIMIVCVGFLTISDLGKIASDSYRRWIRDPRVIRDYLESHSVRKLQLGAGGNDPTGWLNTDIVPIRDEVYLDATQRYPFSDGSFQYVFSEHMIQSVPWEGGVAMLKECYRVLAPGGKLRVVTPNLAKFVQLLAGNPDAEAQRFIATRLRLSGWPESPVTGAYILTDKFAIGVLSSSTTRQRYGRVSNWRDSSRSPNTALMRRPIRFFARQRFVHATRGRTFG